MYFKNEGARREDLGGGVLFQHLGTGRHMTVFHWNMADGAEVKLHQHPSEQFGYVIKGGFRMTIGGDSAELGAGDAYFIPPDVPHTFIAVGDTEAIDVFYPKRAEEDFPNKK
jgi:quercetin dioxygenase-like cupin family protein